MIAQIAAAASGALVAFLGYVYIAIRPPAPKVCGTPGGPPVTSPRVKLSDGRHLAYKENGVAKEDAKYKIIVAHGFGGSKDLNLPLSEEFMKNLQICILSFDRAGYGDSDPNPKRSVKSEAFDIQELADKLQLGPKFFVMGISLGAYSVYSCLNYIPHRISGAALVVPFNNIWWKCFPAELANEAFRLRLPKDRWTIRIAHYTPWLVNWWMTQKWFPHINLMQERKLEEFSQPDQEILKQRAGAKKESKEKILQQGVHESLHRDMIVGFGKWGFDPTDIDNPFPNNEGSVHLWQGYQDYFGAYKLSRYLSQQLPWIQYHEVPDAGHLLIYNATLCEAIFKALLAPNV